MAATGGRWGYPVPRERDPIEGPRILDPVDRYRTFNFTLAATTAFQVAAVWSPGAVRVAITPTASGLFGRFTRRGEPPGEVFGLSDFGGDLLLGLTGTEGLEVQDASGVGGDTVRVMIEYPERKGGGVAP